MSVYNLSHDDLISLGDQVIAHDPDSELRVVVAKIGYDEDAFEHARHLLERFREAVRNRQVARGLQMQATASMNEMREEFHRTTYMPHVKLARLVFDRDGTHERLGITGIRPRAFEAYVNEAQSFYETIEEDHTLREMLAPRGVTADTLAQAQATLEHLLDLKRAQKLAKAELKQANKTLRESRKAFADWLSEYRQFARVATVDQPHLLEHLGITVRSE